MKKKKAKKLSKAEKEKQREKQKQMFLNRQVKSRSAVKLKNAKTDRTVIVAISTDAGCIRYAFLIGKRIGDIVQIGECKSLQTYLL